MWMLTSPCNGPRTRRSDQHAHVPTIEDVRKAGEQARVAVTNAFEQVRTPLLAAIGAGDLATQAVVDAVNKTREQLTERAEAARSAVDELPTDVTSLREKLDPAELRKLVEEYADAAVKLYQHLAEQGEKAVDEAAHPAAVQARHRPAGPGRRDRAAARRECRRGRPRAGRRGARQGRPPHPLHR